MLSAIVMILAGFVVIGLIIVANAYFVAQEFSFMSVDRTQLRTQAAEGDKTAQRALAITQQTSFSSPARSLVLRLPACSSAMLRSRS